MTVTALDEGCVVCGPGEPFTEYEVAEAMFRSGESFVYRHCARCGSLQLASLPDNLASFYDNDRYYSFQPSQRPASTPKRILNARGLRPVLRAQTLAFSTYGVGRGPTWVERVGIRPTQRILDLGCGSGSTVEDLHSFGFDHVHGVDPFVERDRRIAADVHILRRAHHDIDGSYDWVLMHHSFEHVPDPRAVLATCRRVLRPGGRVLIRMPIMGQAAWRRYGTDWAQIDAPRHLVLYTVESTRMLADQEGFVVENVRFDSTAFQFWGSELVRARRSFAAGPVGLQDRLADWDIEAQRLNRALDGDQAMIVLRPSA